MSQIKNSLLNSEWILVSSLLLILASLVVLAKINTYRAAILVETHKLEPVEAVAVTIEGAVARPGTYQIIPGTLMSQVLKKARPSHLADLTRFSANQRIKNPIHIQIEPLREITIYLEGEVTGSCEIHLPPESRLCDLKSKIEFTSLADQAFIQSLGKKRRRLKNGEILFVPNASEPAKNS
jgi:protein involved in polysaccharide export with SLBB domain